MRTQILSAGILAIMMLAASCSQKKEQPVIDKEQIKAEIQAIEAKFASIYNTRDTDSLTYYAEDAVSYFAGQKPLMGKAAIHEFIRQEIAEIPLGVKLQFETIDIYIADDGNIVAEIGALKRIDSTGVVISSGHYVSFFKKQDGKYVCIRDMSNSSPVE